MRRRFFLVCLLVVSLTALTAQEGMEISPPPGAYASAQRVRVSPQEDFEFRLGEEGRFTPVNGVITLDALPGSVERYRLYLRPRGSDGASRSYDFTIDRRPPNPPVPSLPEGRYLAPRTVSFPESPDHIVEHRVNGNYRPLPDEGILLDPGSGGREAYTIRVRSVDSVGNASVSREFVYLIDRTLDSLRPSGGEQQILLSPRPGAYRNSQLLLPDFRLWREVRYTLDGGDPRSGAPVDSPILLEDSGEVTLSVAAISRIDGSERVEEVTFSQGAANSPFPESGVLPRSVTLTPPAEGRYAYTVAGGRRQLLLEELQLEAPPGNRRFLFVSVAPLGSTETVYGHAYLLDDRRPAEPTLLLRRTGARELLLSAFSTPDAEIRYTVEGAVDSGSYLYEEPTTIALPPDVQDRTVTVTSRALLPNGRESEAVVQELTLTTRRPRSPNVTTGERSPSEAAEFFVESSAPLFTGSPAEGETRLPPNALFSEPYLSFTFAPGEEGERQFVFRSASDDGWLWSEPRSISLPVDTLPPPVPEIRITGGRLRLSGEGELEYAVGGDLAAAPSLTNGFVPYTGEVTLSAPEGSVAEYTVEARSRDEAGNQSLSVVERYTVDARSASMPPVRGIQNGGTYREGELYLVFQNPYPEELQIYYELSSSSGSEEPPRPATPSRRSETVRERLLIETPPGEERNYYLRLRAGFATGDLSRTEEFRFSVDRILPEPPRVSLPSSGSPFARTVEVRLLGGGDDSYVAVSEGPALDPLGPRGERYAAPLRIAGREGETITYTVTAARRDAAGNVARMEPAVRFTLDREPPAPPEIVVGSRPQEGDIVRSEPTEISLRADGQLFYTLTRLGRNASLQEYRGEPLPVSGEPGAVIEYRLEAFSIDEAGNRSGTRRLSIRLDRERPDRVADPELIYAPDGRSGTLILSGIPEGNLYLASISGLTLPAIAPMDTGRSVTTSTEASNGGSTAESAAPSTAASGALPRPVAGTIRWRLAEGVKRGTLSLFLEDPAGNRSEPREIVIQARTAPPAPRFAGVPEEDVTNEPVRLRIRTPEAGTVRYTVSTDGTFPPAVTPESPVFGQEEAFTAGSGETIDYVIRARAYNESGEASESTSIRFTVDREPPPPPEIVGIASGEYYPEAQQFTLEGEGEIYYRVLRQGRESNLDGAEFSLYRGDRIELPAQENQLISYQIEAYTRDTAGNRSQEVVQWNAFVDREIVYVSNQTGSDENEGSRNAPLATLSEAIARISGGNRSTIFLANGNYHISRSYQISRPLRLIGGFDPQGWRPTDLRSSLRITEPPPATEEAPASPVETFALTAGGSLTLRRVSLESVHSLPLARVGEGSSLIFEDGLLETTSSPAILGVGGDLRLSEVVVSVPRGGKAIRTEAGSSLDIRDSELAPLEILRSDYAISGSVITATPITTEAATAIVARQSRGALQNTLLRSDARESHLLLLDITGGTLRAEATELVGTAASGITLLRATNSDLRFQRSRFSAVGAASFVYGFVGRNSSIRLSNSIVRIESTASALGFSLLGGKLEVAQSTILLSEVDRNHAFSLGNVSRFVLANSQVHQLGAVSGDEDTLLYLDSPVETAQLVGNNLHGWQRLVTDGGVARQSWGFTSPGVIRRITRLEDGSASLPSIAEFIAYRNISESAEQTFSAGADILDLDDYTLQIGSESVGGGVPLSEILGTDWELNRDFEGNEREDEGRPDIGATGSI